MAATGYSSFSLEKTTFICVSVHPSEQNLEQLKTPTNNSFYIDLQLLSLTNWVTHSESSMIVLGKQVGEVWKIPRISSSGFALGGNTRNFQTSPPCLPRTITDL